MQKKGIRYANDCAFPWFRVSPFQGCAPVYSVDSLSTVLPLSTTSSTCFSLLPILGLTQDLHPLDNAHAEHTMTRAPHSHECEALVDYALGQLPRTIFIIKVYIIVREIMRCFSRATS